MAKPGRRPSGGDTRAEIVAAARVSFARDGYERASLREIARRAGVDPALVHHYFDGKAELFMAVMNLRRDPAGIVDDVQQSSNKGAVLARAFLASWEPMPDAQGPPPFATMAQAVCASPEIADALREFLTQRVWARVRLDGMPEGPNLRQSLVSSQLFGVALSRYVMRLEPLASASLDDAAEWLGQLLQQTFEMPLPIKDQSGTH
jgi:AcrR family transcriptional regulator